MNYRKIKSYALINNDLLSFPEDNTNSITKLRKM